MAEIWVSNNSEKFSNPVKGKIKNHRIVLEFPNGDKWYFHSFEELLKEIGKEKYQNCFLYGETQK